MFSKLLTHMQMRNVVIDPTKQLSARTGSSGYPTTLFYDAKGRLASRHVGELYAAILGDKINQLRDARLASNTCVHDEVQGARRREANLDRSCRGWPRVTRSGIHHDRLPARLRSAQCRRFAAQQTEKIDHTQFSKPFAAVIIGTQ